MKFDNIKTLKDLNEKIQNSECSVGNKSWAMKKFFTTEKQHENAEEVTVIFTCVVGKNSVKRYINYKIFEGELEKIQKEKLKEELKEEIKKAESKTKRKI